MDPAILILMAVTGLKVRAMALPSLPATQAVEFTAASADRLQSAGAADA
jgi:hypothetical protein